MLLKLSGNKTFNNNLIVGGNLGVAGTVTQSNSQEVNFNDTRLRLNIPTGLLDGSIENTAHGQYKRRSRNL